MAVKYAIEYNDTENVLHRFEILDDAYSGSEIEVRGSVFLDYAETDNPLEAIRGSGLRVELEADSSLTFNDLYTEEERSFQVIYYRDSDIKFKGWLNPEGWYEDYVNNNWLVSFDCVDGLGFLESLSYVDNDTGLFFTGKQSQLEIIVNCLKRTGIEQNINTNIDIIYFGHSVSVDILTSVHLNADRFVKEDEDTIMSCEDVLRSILEPYAACITSVNGEWYIYKPNQLFLDTELDVYTYDFEGAQIGTGKKTVETSLTIGSFENSFYPHYANENQSITNKRSIGAYRINYKYGLVGTFNPNTYLTHDSSTINGWTIDNFTNLFLDSDGAGVIFQFNGSTPVKNMTSDPIVLSEGNLVNFSMSFITESLTKNGSGTVYGEFNYKIILTGLSTYYYNGVAWSLTDSTIKENILEVGYVKNLSLNLSELPIDGSITLEVHTPNQLESHIGVIELTSMSIAPRDEKTTNPDQGEFHTFQRTTKPSSKVEDTKEVYNGDGESGIYLGTIFKADEITPTNVWHRIGVTEEFPILQVMGEETMRMSPSTARTFSGDVYGFFDYLSVITLDGISGKFMPIKYSCNTKDNIIDMELRQIFGNELTDIDYKVTIDYGNVVSPTIIG